MGSEFWNKDKRIDQPLDPYGGGVVPRGWQEVWQRALTGPNLENYLDLLRTSDATTNRGAAWVYVAAMISFILSTVAQAIWGEDAGLGALMNTQTTSTSGTTTTDFSPLALIVCSPILAGIGVLFWIVFAVGIPHVVAMIFGGRGGFERMVFLFAAFTAPVSIINGLFSLIPLAGTFFSLAMWIYTLLLGTIAIQAVHQIGWVQSAIAMLAIPIIVFACVFICFASLLTSALSGSGFIVPELLFSLF